MQDKHTFSRAYMERRNAVLGALLREESIGTERHSDHFTRTAIRILASVVIFSALTVSVYAAVQWIDFHMEQDGNEVHIHASLNETAENDGIEKKPVRSWNAENGEISIRLNIPDLPSDMFELKNTNGKYDSEDTSRAMTINGIDLRRSDLNQIIGGEKETKQIDVGGKTMFVIGSNNDAVYYNRTVYILFEEEELVLKLWVSYGITDDELNALASTMTIEETTDATLALPIINEFGDDSYDWTTPITIEREPIYERDIAAIGESVRDTHDHYTITVDEVEIFDSISELNPNCILRADFVERFTDDAGSLIPYNRTEKLYIQDGEYWTIQFGDTIESRKKLVVITFTMSDIEEGSYYDGNITPTVNGYQLFSYTVTDGEINFSDTPNAVIDRKPEARADTTELIYREYLGDNRWKVAYLIEQDMAEDNLAFYSYTGNVTVKIH